MSAVPPEFPPEVGVEDVQSLAMARVRDMVELFKSADRM